MLHYRATHLHFSPPSLAAAAAALLLLPAVPRDAAAQGASSGGIGSGVSGGARGGVSGGFGAVTSPPSSLSRSTGALSPSRSLSTTAPSTGAPGALPPSAIGTAAPRVQPVAPLSPPTTSTFLGRGEATVTLPGGITTTVPSEVGTTPTFRGGGSSPAAPGATPPSTPGGGGDTFADCMGFWDAQTHMTKREWAGACRRVMNRLKDLQKELGPPAASPAQVARRRGR